MSKRTALFPAHKKLGAKIIEFGSWLMPLYYTSIVDEHKNVRQQVGLFDVSHMGEFVIKGKNALSFLQQVITNDVFGLNDNQALYSPMCNDKGTIIDDLLVYRFSAEHFMLVVNASNIDKDYRWIAATAEKFDKDIVLENISDQTSLLALQGPRCEEVLQKLTDVNLARMKSYHFQEGTIEKFPVAISRTGYTGEAGFEIYFKSEYALRIWTQVLAAGQTSGIKPAGLGARDTLRLECAMLLYGNDIDEYHTPLETNIAWTVKFAKEDFIGRDALLRQKEEGTRESLVGFQLLEPGIPRHSYSIWKDKKKIGRVTSGSFSPTLKKGIGLGYVEDPFSEVGMEFQIQGRDKLVRARIVEIPFYRRSY
jgi:aminomethyltransferase